MAKCETCGAPVNLAPDGDPKYEPPSRISQPVQGTEEMGRALNVIEDFIGHCDGRDIVMWNSGHETCVNDGTIDGTEAARALDAMREALRRLAPAQVSVTDDFKDRSAKAAIRALRGLEQTAIMLEKYAPEIFPEVNEQGQKHFGRVMMEAAAEEIRNAWSSAVNEAALSAPARQTGETK